MSQEPAINTWRKTVTVLPGEKVIIVDGIPQKFNFSINPAVRSVQWSDGAGVLEYKANDTLPLMGQDDYDTHVLPYVEAWAANVARQPSLLDMTKQKKLKDINIAYTEAVAYTKAGTPEDEVITWDIQKTEAEAWALDAATPTPCVDNIARGRDMDRELLLTKILEKVAAYREIVFYATGIRQKLEDNIKAAKSVQDVHDIAWPQDPLGPS